MIPRPFVLSIAGLDPSAGAGLLADIKVFENQQVYGLGVCSATTIQHDSAFFSVHWISVSQIIYQCIPLFERYPISVVKIGLIQSLECLDEVISWIRKRQPSIAIIWDPILKASAGFTFHSELEYSVLKSVLSKLTLLTPNLPEARKLTGNTSATQAALDLSNHSDVYLKGGHSGHTETIIDVLYQAGNQTATYPSDFIPNGEKHGSGCVLSACIAAQLAKGYSMTDACIRARSYMNQFLASTPYLLGYQPIFS